jgi:hypothetical protein
VALRILRLQKRQSAGDFFGFFGALKRTQKSPATPKNAILAVGVWQRTKFSSFEENRPNGLPNPRTIIHQTAAHHLGVTPT